MASQPNHFRHESSSPYITNDNISEKTVEMDVISPPPPPPSALALGSMFNDPTRQPKQQPSYMAPTKSAKAKARAQGPTKPKPAPQPQPQPQPQMPQWNSSIKKPSPSFIGHCDSSSSGGGTVTTTTYPTPRSPSPMGNGPRAHARRGFRFNPDSNGPEEWMLHAAAGGWRHDHFG